jgi:3'(2'), 5'-bisphosphate nucleotidase
LTLSVDADLVNKVRDIALRAGEAIMEVYSTDFSVERKDDSSPVTEADQKAETLILKAIRREITDEYPIVAEESVAAGDVPDITGTRFWLVDPLDGTKQFVNRQGEFTVNIALIENGRPLLGVVHAPAIGSTYWGSEPGAFAVTDGGEPHPIHCRTMPE